jgi:uncharacterized protein YycO
MVDGRGMKRRIASWLIVLQMLAAVAGGEIPALREGDILFTSCERGQGEAIIAATRSPYTHCGVVFERDGKLMVLEAVQPVRVSTLAAFMANGRKEHFIAKRLKTPVKPEFYRKAREWATAQVGRDYDLRFGWDDAKLYCSELVWKIYQKAGVELCAPKRFRDYDLDQPSVRRIIEQRFGGMHRVPMDEKVVAPSDLADSPLLVDVPKAGAR